MAGGSMVITVPHYNLLTQVAQRVTCWAGGVGGADTRQVQLVTMYPWPAIRIPEEIFAAHGALALEPGGADILSGYVAGTNVTFNAVNGAAAFQNPNSCAADNAQSPTISTIAMNVGGNPLAITLNYANFAGNGAVNIIWGDGTTTAGAAESGASNHTYPNPGTYTIQVLDATSPSVFVQTTIWVPGV